MTFEEWKQRSKQKTWADMVAISDFERLNPCTTHEYMKRRELERQKRNEIMLIQNREERLKMISENMELFR